MTLFFADITFVAGLLHWGDDYNGITGGSCEKKTIMKIAVQIPEIMYITRRKRDGTEH